MENMGPYREQNNSKTFFGIYLSWYFYEDRLFNDDDSVLFQMCFFVDLLVNTSYYCWKAKQVADIDC